MILSHGTESIINWGMGQWGDKMSYEIVNGGEPLTWEEFEDIIKYDINQQKNDRRGAEIKAMHSPWIYRGQENQKFNLSTTYERFLSDELGIQENETLVSKFYNYMDSIIPALNSLAGTNFNGIDSNDINTIRRFKILPCYELLCYARHYGFPSPLLDWTNSYYIAAYFAFYKCRKSEDVAIYAYKEWSGDARGGSVGNPIMNEHGHYVKAPIRHHRQQSVYTSCSFEKQDGQLYFQNHQYSAGLSANQDNHKIKKFILKNSEREKVLEMLFSMNINKYTLFDDIDSLMHMLAYREIVLNR